MKGEYGVRSADLLGLATVRRDSVRKRSVPRARVIVLGVGLLASGLAACRSPAAIPASRSALADSADQIMYGARFNLTDGGVLRAELEADTAYFFDDNTRVEMDRVRSIFFTQAGVKDAVLTSKHGRYNTRAGDMMAHGDVVVINEAGRRLTTPELQYNQARNEIYSDSAFTMTEPGRELSGIGFRSDPNLNNIRVLRGATGFVSGAGGAAPPPPPAAPATPATPATPAPPGSGVREQ